MRRPWKWIIAYSLAALVMAGAFYALTQRDEMFLAQAELPDGSILRLRAVTYGRHHELPLPPRTVIWPIPGTIEQSFERQTPGEVTMLWFSRHDAATREPLDFEWWLGCSTVDPMGTTIKDRLVSRDACSADMFGSRRTDSGSSDRPLRPMASPYDHLVCSSVIPNFRCSGSSFRVRVHHATEDVVAEFDVPWLGPTSFETWKPETLPATRSTDDLAVTLESITARHADQLGELSAELSVDTKLTITRDGQPADCSIESVLICDALGNYASSSNCYLAAHEIAWKVEAVLYPAPDATIYPDEACVVDRIQLPPAETYEELNRKQTVNGATIHLLHVAGPGPVSFPQVSETPQRTGGGHASGSFVIGDYDYNFMGDYKIEYTLHTDADDALRSLDANAYHILLEGPGPRDVDQRFRVEAIDDRGQPVIGQLHWSHDKLFWFFRPAEGAQSIELTLFVQRAKKVEFVVAPPNAE